MVRVHYQRGSLNLLRRRGPWVWVLRHYDNEGHRKAVIVGTIEQYPTEKSAMRAADAILMQINHRHEKPEMRFGILIERYRRKELPDRASTRAFYLPWIKNHILPRWGDTSAREIAEYPFQVEQWLNRLELAPKSRAHIRSLMSIMFNCAMRWGVLKLQVNPMRFVRVKNVSKRVRKRRVLSPTEIRAMLPFIPQPYRTMVLVAACLGLRASEVAALKWGDFNWDIGYVIINRAVVIGVVGDVKTYDSAATMPVDVALVEVLLAYKMASVPIAGSEDWLFPSPVTGRPYSTTHIQSEYIEPAGRLAELGPSIGWHNFRHSYSTLLRALKVDIKVQQALLRHADIRTTMNIYTVAVDEELRKAHGKAVKALISDEVKRLLAPEKIN